MRRSASLGVGVLAVLGLSAVAPALAVAPDIEARPPVKLPRLDRANFGPSAARSASGDAVVAWLTDTHCCDGTGTPVLRARRGPGGAFGPLVRFPPGDATSVRVAMNDSGAAVAVFVRGRRVEFARRGPTGTWVRGGAAPLTVGAADPPPLLSLGPDEVLDVLTRSSASAGGVTTTTVSTARLRGLAWSRGPALTVTTGSATGAVDTALGPSGQALVVWADGAGPVMASLRTRRVVPFRPATVIAPADADPLSQVASVSATVGPDVSLLAGWARRPSAGGAGRGGIAVWARDDIGWEPAREIGVTLQAPALTSDARGALVALWALPVTDPLDGSFRIARRPPHGDWITFTTPHSQGVYRRSHPIPSVDSPWLDGHGGLAFRAGASADDLSRVDLVQPLASSPIHLLRIATGTRGDPPATGYSRTGFVRASSDPVDREPIVVLDVTRRRFPLK